MIEGGGAYVQRRPTTTKPGGADLGLRPCMAAHYPCGSWQTGFVTDPSALGRWVESRPGFAPWCPAVVPGRYRALTMVQIARLDTDDASANTEPTAVRS